MLLSIISIESKVAKNINFDNLTNEDRKESQKSLMINQDIALFIILYKIMIPKYYFL